jgi:hypothetical protein
MPKTDDRQHDRLHTLTAAALRSREDAADRPLPWHPRRKAGRVVPRLLLGATVWWIIVAQSIALLE